MLDQIQEVVRKNLPAEVGDQLKKHLSDAETWKRERDYAHSRIEGFEKLIKVKDEAIVDLNAKLKLAGNLDDREKSVMARENKLEVQQAQQETRAAEKALDAVFRLTETAFRNPRIVRMHTESEMVPINTNGYVQQHSKTKTVTDEEQINP